MFNVGTSESNFLFTEVIRKSDGSCVSMDLESLDKEELRRSGCQGSGFGLGLALG